MKIKKGDKVKILIGKNKGKIGEVEKIFIKTESVIVPGVNEFKRHVKSRARNQKSEIMTITKPVPVSNVALICPKCNKPTRIGYMTEKGKKVRVCRKCKKAID